MSIVFYSAPMSSAGPVEAALRELEVPHEKVSFDLSKQDHKKPEYLKINPNGRVPALVVDGAPMFEALAIMQWLGDRYGVARGVWPQDGTKERFRALSFSTWAYVQYGAAMRMFIQASSSHVPKELHHPGQAESSRRELRGLLEILDRELAAAPYLLGNTFSLLDLIVANVVGYSAYMGVDVSPHDRVSKWLRDCQARPSMQRA
jgi:glutathione S-transferase